MPTAIAVAEITSWDPQETAAAGEGETTRVLVLKRFTGALVGTSTTQLLGTTTPGGRGYVAQEVVEGVFEGRTGTFVLQHGGLETTGETPTGFGAIVPGSGTGELEGLRGTALYEDDGDAPRLTLTYEL